MSPLASLMLAKGFCVSGSDIKEGPVIQRLKELGGRIVIGHDKENINGADCVVYSSAIKEDNPEIIAARNKKIPLLKRARLLAELMERHVGITVAGTHGKTTTTSMISQLLMKAGLNPTTAIGGVVNGDVDHAALGSGRYFVAEVDESDGSFLYFRPQYSVITNIDFEHVDYYHNWDNILKAYRQFIDHTQPQGLVIACGDDTRLRKLLSASTRKFITYGFLDTNDIVAKNIREVKEEGTYSEQFDCLVKGKNLGTIQLAVPGRHNILNALACLGVGLNLSIGPFDGAKAPLRGDLARPAASRLKPRAGDQDRRIDFSVIQEGLNSYQGVKRRFQIVGEVDDVVIVDDYGHHPTEIRATLETALSLKRKRIVTVFQPHRYSRTKLLWDDFLKALSLSDDLIITDIYAASEPRLEGVSSEKLCEQISGTRGKGKVIYLKKEEITEHLLGITQPGDLILTLGAGDIYQIAEDFVCALKNRQRKNTEVAGEIYS